MIRDFEYSAVWITYGAALLLVGFWRKAISLRWQALVLIGFTVGKVFLYDTSSLDRIYRVLSFYDSRVCPRDEFIFLSTVT